MSAPPAASLIDLLLGLALAPADQGPGNRFSIEGLSFAAGGDGAYQVGIRKLEAASLRLESGPLVLEVGSIALHELAARVRFEEGRPRLVAFEAAGAELAGVSVHGPLALAQSYASGESTARWLLEPLAAAEGTIRGQILDAHLLFDADVTVPIRHGRIDFKDATVAHVGPDSRMGASRLGFYVDAPNGRSYLYQFQSAPVLGVAYERRGAMLGPWVTDRGNVQLQPFAEWLLRQGWGGHTMAVPEQARRLFDRTSVSGALQLGDGKFAAPGVQAELVGRAEGRNSVRLHSEAVGRALTLELAALSVRDAAVGATAARFGCEQLTAALTLRLFAEAAQLRFAFALPQMKLSGLRLQGAGLTPG